MVRVWELAGERKPREYDIGLWVLWVGWSVEAQPLAIRAEEGRVAGRNALRIINAETTARFSYYNKGDLATIGRNRAVAVFGGRVEVSGYLA